MSVTAIFSSHSPHQRGWQDTAFAAPIAEYVAANLAQVVPLLQRAEAAAAAGHWCALCLSYEAAPALNPDLRTHAPGGLPLAWLAVFDQPAALPPASAAAPAAAALQWQESISRCQYNAALAQLQQHLAAGDIYQVNYTMRWQAPFAGNALAWFQQLSAAQQAGYCAYIDMGRWQLLSISPELFFQRRGNLITTRPMKGTLPRGRWQCEDQALMRRLQSCPKNRAENLMIVDLLRNDLGRVALPGSVQVPQLFAIEAYRSVLQMTTTVQAEVAPPTSLLDLLRALFPCGSITGAPKIRAQQLIRQLEPDARGIYTGCIGLLRPGGDCDFNVAIRTVVVDRQRQTASVGVGGGITADSQAADEYAECATKLRFLSAPPAPAFALLESLRLEDGVFTLLARHLQRLLASAAYFGYLLDEAVVQQKLAAIAAQHRHGCWKVRLLADAAGHITVEAAALAPPPAVAPPPWRLALANHAVAPDNVLLYHKTSARDIYDHARAAMPCDCDDALLYNCHGYVTESTIANLVYEWQQQLWTPPCSDGLLPGTMRAELLAAGNIAVRSLPLAQLPQIPRLYLINSVRGWIPATLSV